MWILARLFVAIIGFLVRLFLPKFKRLNLENDPINGLYHDKKLRGKSGSVYEHEMGVPFRNDIIFSFSNENIYDKCVKYLGLTEEFQTGNAAFDEKVFIACDHLNFAKILMTDSVLRHLILDVLNRGVRQIYSDGQYIFFKASREMDRDFLIKKLKEIGELLQKGIVNLPQRYQDALALKVVLVEALVWSVVGYASFAFMEYLILPYSYHLDVKWLWIYGLILAGFVFMFIQYLIVLYLQRSSRAHRVITESAALLVLSLPILGVQAISDINRHFDMGPAQIVEVTVHGTWVRHRKGTDTYYMRFSVISGQNENLGAELGINSTIFDQLNRDVMTTQIVVQEGFLKIPWVKSVHGIEL